MRVLETTVDLDATPSEVWDVLTDFAAYPEWNPFITSISGPAVPGEHLRVDLRSPGGRTVTMKPRVRSAVPARQLSWLGHLGIPGLFDGEHEFVIEPGSNGSSRFTQRETFRGALVPFLGRLLAQTEQGFVAMNAALKARVETR
ncbi:MAG TPA: SRPBCC domain-containing protein [Acidimicrobiia bacterium]|nr:SRPBCC domain-containing protein [Acidimicrobiia bacterium]